MNYTGWPETGELVVGEVDEIENFGVFVDLLQYDDKRGLVHISEVASGWIKSIRDHVREGQTVVCKVLDVDESSHHIDLSLKDVNDHQRSETIQEWKNEQKADKWFTLAFGEDLGDDEYRSLASTILEGYDSLYDAFEAAAVQGADALEGIDLDDGEVDAFVDTARENVSVPFVTISGYIDLECPDGDGVDAIKGALEAAEGDGDIPEEIELEVTYVGAPEYRIRVKAPDYKTAEDHLEASAERAAAALEAEGGTGTYHRDRHEDEEQ